MRIVDFIIFAVSAAFLAFAWYGNTRDRLLEERIIRPGETYQTVDYGEVGGNHLVCRYQFRGDERIRVYTYAPNDFMGRSFCPEQFDSKP